jgi:hypothetical protein
MPPAWAAWYTKVMKRLAKTIIFVILVLGLVALLVVNKFPRQDRSIIPKPSPASP